MTGPVHRPLRPCSNPALSARIPADPNRARPFQMGLRPKPPCPLAGAHRPAPRPRGAQVRACARAQRYRLGYPPIQTGLDRFQMGLRPKSPCPLAGPHRPAPRPRGAQVRACARAQRSCPHPAPLPEGEGEAGALSSPTSPHRLGYPPIQTGLDHAIASFAWRTRT